MKTPYRIFTSEGGDWYIAAKRVDGVTTVLFENHDSSGAYEAIVKDMGVRVPMLERDMSRGGYDPKTMDWR
jgi:hypothetical protein